MSVISSSEAGLAAAATHRSIGQRLWWASGVLVLLFAFGAGAWTSGAAAWVVDGCGGGAATIVAAGEAGYVAGFVTAVMESILWYARRCRRGREDLSICHVAAAMLALPVGAIAWAIFVDAIAWHHREDLVRTPVDYVIMYTVLISAIPVAVGVPLIVRRLQTALPQDA